MIRRSNRQGGAIKDFNLPDKLSGALTNLPDIGRCPADQQMLLFSHADYIWCILGVKSNSLNVLFLQCYKIIIAHKKLFDFCLDK